MLGYPLVPLELTWNPILVVVHMVCCLTHMLEKNVFNSRKREPRDLQVPAVGTFESGIENVVPGHPDALLPRP